MHLLKSQFSLPAQVDREETRWADDSRVTPRSAERTKKMSRRLSGEEREGREGQVLDNVQVIVQYSLVSTVVSTPHTAAC